MPPKRQVKAAPKALVDESESPKGNNESPRFKDPAGDTMMTPQPVTDWPLSLIAGPGQPALMSHLSALKINGLKDALEDPAVEGDLAPVSPLPVPSSSRHDEELLDEPAMNLIPMREPILLR
ncbi:unnamed protein product [Closterium sp. NIES-54]